ncbi:MAG: TatD family hydrolase [Alphaproteobacteria bacterium]|nr:TatD family hydrolase [Alphaproteobacteria bacterium]
MFTDSHCHINAADFDADREETVDRARNAGVQYMLDVCDDIADMPRQTAFCAKHQNIYTTVGVHPEIADKYPHFSAADLVAQTASPYVVGIGECGLDYYYNSNIKDAQIKVLHEHIKAAQETGLPLIIHNRDADEDMMQILDEAYRRQKFNGELHCFSSSAALADFALGIGFYVSASGIITFKKSEELREIFRRVPIERLLIETDAPFLAPTPYRGKRNEPAYVVHTAAVLAELKEVDAVQLAAQTTVNFLKLFNKVQKHD